MRRDPEFAESLDSGDAVVRQSRECRPLVPARRLFCLITVFDFLAAVIIWLLYANVSTIFRFVQWAMCTFPAHHTRNSSRICRIFADRLNPRYETQRSGLHPVFPESKFPSHFRGRFRGRFPRSSEVLVQQRKADPRVKCSRSSSNLASIFRSPVQLPCRESTFKFFRSSCGTRQTIMIAFVVR